MWFVQVTACPTLTAQDMQCGQQDSGRRHGAGWGAAAARHVAATPSLVMPAYPVGVAGCGDRKNDLAGRPGLSHRLALKPIVSTSSGQVVGDIVQGR